MRKQIVKIKRGQSTKAERRFMELCKQNRIPFEVKVKIAGREVDFLIGKFAIELDGHPQDVPKNWKILEAGYTPFHLQNNQVTPALGDWLKKIYSYGR